MSDRPRIILVGPAKTGNVWVQNILACIYRLRICEPGLPNLAAFEAFARSDRFEEGMIFIQHWEPAAPYFEALAHTPHHLITVLRDPYDTFVSLYFFIQKLDPATIQPDDPARAMVGKPIDHPDVIHYLATGFQWSMELGCRWQESGKSLVVHYEDLHRRPLLTTRAITDRIEPVPDGDILKALGACGAQRLRAKGSNLAHHVRSATIGDWRNHLNADHLRAFRDHHADLIKRLGYQVVQDPP